MSDPQPISPAPSKQCIKCKVVKPAAEFHRDRTRADGLFPYCKRCHYRKPALYDRKLEKDEIAARNESLGLRLCNKCGVWKSRVEFNRSRLGKFGLESRCRSCKRRPASEVKAAYEAEVAREFETGLRWCRTCLETKPLGAFYHVKGRRRGLLHCKECYKVDKRRYAQAHPEIYRKASLEWQARNPGAIQAMNHRRRAYKKNAPGSFTAVEWLALKKANNFTCLKCGKREPEIKLTVDHIIPVTDGGSSDITNIQPLCKPCNSAKGTRAVDLRLGKVRKTRLQRTFNFA